MKPAAVLLLALVWGEGAAGEVQFVKDFANTNHPEIAYWFFSKDVLQDERYLATVDRLANDGLYTLIFVTARNGVDFYDYGRMKPIFAKLVARAHQRGLKIGLQLWPRKSPVAEENRDSVVVEGEVTLDAYGEGVYRANTRHIRSDAGPPIRSALLRAFAFQETDKGFYRPESLQDVTPRCVTRTPDPGTAEVEIHGGPELRGRRVYLMTRYEYDFSSNHGPDASARFLAALHEYRDIPFDGVALDEYSNLRITPPWEIEKTGELFRERTWSPALAKAYEAKYRRPLEQALFDMRYAPAGDPAIRIRAINTYMDEMRHGPLRVEEAVYQTARATFGPDTFAGFHDTHHNALPFDEIWTTGLNWWTLPRLYGHTDENSPLPTQMGIALSAPGNAMYNMYYDKSLDRVVEKALGDLRFGIRTIYHAIDDVQGWGVSVDKPESLAGINPVERSARLLNRFNPALPRIRLLVIFGMEALSNWYPNESQRGVYDINDKLAIEEKAVKLWNAGYLNALVSSDVIVAGRLKLDVAGRPTMNGHTFDAVIYLNPEYSREPVLRFLEEYVQRGGKLMVEGRASYDFEGHSIAPRFDAILRKALATRFSVEGVARLGVSRNLLPDRCLNEDGSWVFTDLRSLRTGNPAVFEVRSGNDIYSGDYRGAVALAAGDSGLGKLAASGLTTLRRNGTVIFSLSQPSDVFINRQGNGYSITIAGKAGAGPLVNLLPGN